MSKKLIAVRLNKGMVEKLKEIALKEGKSQAKIVSEGLGLYLMTRAIQNENLETKTKQSYTTKEGEYEKN